MGMAMKITSESEQFIIICAWCKQVLNDVVESKDTRKTHTICPTCFEAEMRKISKIQRTHLPR